MYQYLEFGTKHLLPKPCTKFMLSRSWRPHLGANQNVGTKILVLRSWYGNVGINILAPRTWYQHFCTRHWIPAMWYQHRDTKILVLRIWWQDLGATFLVQLVAKRMVQVVPRTSQCQNLGTAVWVPDLGTTFCVRFKCSMSCRVNKFRAVPCHKPPCPRVRAMSRAHCCTSMYGLERCLFKNWSYGN